MDAVALTASATPAARGDTSLCVTRIIAQSGDVVAERETLRVLFAA